MKKQILLLAAMAIITSARACYDIYGSSFQNGDTLERGSQQWVDVKISGGASFTYDIVFFIKHADSTKWRRFDTTSRDIYINHGAANPGVPLRCYITLPDEWKSGKSEIKVCLGLQTLDFYFDKTLSVAPAENETPINAPCIYYTLNGQQAIPTQGLYIQVCGTTRKKIYITQ